MRTRVRMKTQTQTTMTKRMTQTGKRAKREEGIVRTATAKERGEWLRKVLSLRKLNKVFLALYYLIL